VLGIQPIGRLLPDRAHLQGVAVLGDDGLLNDQAGPFRRRRGRNTNLAWVDVEADVVAAVGDALRFKNSYYLAA